MPDSDRALLRGIERGEADALERLALEYAPPVYRYLVRLCGDATLAEDLAQEVALQIWRALPGRRFPNAAALRSWIYTVATNCYRMELRRRRGAEVAWNEELSLAAGEECDPAQAAERAETVREVRRALQGLPDREREALLLKAYSHLGVREIASITGEPAGTVKWRLSCAYRRLRDYLAPILFPTPPSAEGSALEESHALPTTPVVSDRPDPRRRVVVRGTSPEAVRSLLRSGGG